jgi:hypothetical protein
LTSLLWKEGEKERRVGTIRGKEGIEERGPKK